MTTAHVVLWIDHKEAKIFHVNETGFDAEAVKAPGAHVHRHPQHTAEHAHPVDLNHFFDRALQALEGAREVLVMGPGSAKLELIKYVHKHRPGLESMIVGVETSDHPTDGQVVAHARKYFLAADKVR